MHSERDGGVRQERVNEGYTYTEVLGPGADGHTLLAYLVERHPHSDEAAWRARVARHEVRLDGAPTDEAAVLRRGQQLTWHKPPWMEPAAPLDVTVLFEDDEVLAVAKPSGLPVLPGAGYLEHTLLAWVRARVPGASPVHRLGRGTSGLVLFAKAADAARALQTQWTRKEITKVYRALVEAVVSADGVVVDAPIGSVPDDVVGALFAATPAGKPARSILRVRERRTATTLLDVTIETGRPHQIRIHTAYAGHALVGDPLYGAGGTRRADSAARPGDVGYHLHAHTLSFTHPRTGARQVIEAPPPALLSPAPLSSGP